jgi:YbbR domain-containing protein
MKEPKDFLHNIRLKGAALLLAVLSWAIVSQITNNETGISDVPVNIIIPQGWAIRDQDMLNVDVTFRGTREDLLQLDERTVEVVVDLRDEEFLTERSISLTPRMVNFTAGNVRVTELQPNSVHLRFGREGSKELPVLVTQRGQPPEGLTVESIQVEPSVIRLFGEQELLETVSSVQTVPLDLSDRVRSFEQRLEVVLPTEGWVGRVSPSRVLVKATLAGVTEERSFPNIPLLMVHPVNQEMENWDVAPSTVEVFLTASPQRLDGLDPSEIRAFIAVDDVEAAEPRIRVLVPPGIDVLGVRPDTAVVQRVPSEPPPAPSPTPSTEPSSP